VAEATEPTKPAYGPVCDTPVQHASMVHWWDDLTFLHWRYEREVVQRLLPEGLTVETYDGTAWVGLVPFAMRVALPRGPSVPWLTRFPETNVRTYVRARDGSRGIWFFSLDAARLAAVLTARTTYRLPYFWSHMSIEHAASTVVYSCERRWPGPTATSKVAVEIGGPFDSSELIELDHFLTARWRLYSASHGRLRRAQAWHEPWPLQHARALAVDDGLVVAAGLPQPEGDPLVHYSPSVKVRIGWPSRPPT
jgi:uncharacterized protein YqjF (DUF2071 family)